MPNKVISVKESSIYKASVLLGKFSGKISIDNLFELSKSDFTDIPDFLDALVLLFALKRIDIDYMNGEVFRVTRN
ncbi:ABC-three component system middle component 7 [Pantoea agglomerans]|uniref:ABC-three component system middle component 7 n=1 Tax=Enterobacter agglomerans TaxID=549 RepID=UPI0032092902